MIFQVVVVQNIPSLSGVNRHTLWALKFKVSSLNYQNSNAMMFCYLKHLYFLIFFLEALVFVQEIGGHDLVSLCLSYNFA